VSNELIIFDIQDNRFALPASAVSKVLDPLVFSRIPSGPA